jgi:hypothetical protein
MALRFYWTLVLVDDVWEQSDLSTEMLIGSAGLIVRPLSCNSWSPSESASGRHRQHELEGGAKIGIRCGP